MPRYFDTSSLAASPTTFPIVGCFKVVVLMLGSRVLSVRMEMQQADTLGLLNKWKVSKMP